MPPTIGPAVHGRRAVAASPLRNSDKLRHVPRAENAHADSVVNRAIDERLPVPEWLRPALAAV